MTNSGSFTYSLLVCDRSISLENWYTNTCVKCSPFFTVYNNHTKWCRQLYTIFLNKYDVYSVADKTCKRTPFKSPNWLLFYDQNQFYMQKVQPSRKKCAISDFQMSTKLKKKIQQHLKHKRAPKFIQIGRVYYLFRTNPDL